MYKSFQEISIDWSKASKEYQHQAFKSVKEIENSDYLYSMPFQQTIKWLQAFRSDECVDTEKQDSKNQGTNNIFSIVGERGVGKSSFINTLRNSIERNMIFEQTHTNLYCFPTLDPSLFAGKIKLIESVLAMMKNKVDLACQNDGRYSLKDQSIYGKVRFDKKIKEIVKLLQDMRIEKSSYAENKTRVEVLDNLQNQMEFRKNITELIDHYLDVINMTSEKEYSHICLFIDDLDLVPNEIAYETLQDIFKFLQYQKKVVLFLAYREEQLINSVVSNLLVDNKNILVSQSEFSTIFDTGRTPFITAEEIKEQATNMLEKGLPRAQRTYLLINKQTKIKDILGPFIAEKPQINDVFGNKTITDFMKEEVRKQTRLVIEPMDQIEITDLVYPRQLRGLLQYLEIIHNFHPFQEAIDRDEKLEVSLPLMRKNIKSLKYFLISKFRDSLNKIYMNIIDSWLERDYSSRNSLVVTGLLDLVESSKVQHEDMLLSEYEMNLYHKSAYNVTLGNVFTVFERFKTKYYGNVQALNFLYALKILYSIENLLLLTKSLNKFCSSEAVKGIYDESMQELNLSNIVSAPNSNTVEHDKSIEPLRQIIQEIGLEQYFMLVKGKIMPDTFYYNDKLNGKYAETNFNLYYVQRLFFSDISASGDIRKFGEDQPVYQPSQKYYSFKFRNFFEKRVFVNGYNYLVDPFASLTDMSYVLEVFHHICYGKELKEYLFYNMFDLDFFVRKSYTRQNEKNPFNYALDKVNDIFVNTLNTSDEISLRANMSIPIVVKSSAVSSVFKPLIDIEKLKLAKEEETLIDESELLDEAKQNINRFVDMYNDEPNAYNINVNIVKDFLRSYWAVYRNWPSSMTHREKERATDTIRPSNRNQISGLEVSYLEKIVTELERQGDS
ncbi:hypothetical protein ABID30_002283 [Enterococcus rotai]|uniref:KAP NTPase domain-containing protein n=1 Tax=Enterococcus rotai TaxID=118060 RepID=A0A0U2VVR1_9ENTE|nr:P-loop NTPase fold protein [Enterococcus rotai]ALS38415.1 hypothetical protein ATZ35_15040 [Enterococcus rotai]